MNERADPGYEAAVRQQLHDKWLNKDYEAILKVFQEHPYVLQQGIMAYLRANCFEHLKDYPAAAVFFADAIKWTPDDPDLVLSSAGGPLELVGRGGLDEAWKYVVWQLKEMPHAITFITASTIRFHQAKATKGAEEQKGYSREQFHYYQAAWLQLQQLPPLFRNHRDLKDFMVFCFETTALGLDRVGDKAKAVEICNVAIDFVPKAFGPRTVRGTITYPAEQSLQDFREAIQLGEPSYYPYYNLAHAALMVEDDSTTASRCWEALERKPSHRIAAQLWAWLAVAEARLGKKPENIRDFLKKAQILDPDNPDISRLAEQLEGTLTVSLPDSFKSWEPSALDTSWADYPSEHEARVVKQRDQAGRAQEELALVET